MKRKRTRFYKKYHKWIGWIASFFILMFAISGILLNHRQIISKYEIPRTWLPKEYHFEKWNNNAVRGTLCIGKDSVLMYGSSGIWLTDSTCSHSKSFAKGMPTAIDNRDFRAVQKTSTNSAFAISYHRLYQLNIKTSQWSELTDKIVEDDIAFADLYNRNDTLYVITRSYIYESTPPYTSFQKHILKAPNGFSENVSLFKTMWILHSGEIFGILGKIFVDILGILIIILCITGILISIFRSFIKKRRRKEKNIEPLKRKWKFSLKWHNKLGYIPYIALLVLVITGTFLRPPLIIAIVRAKIPPIPFSTLDSNNPWHKKLRVLRYDDTAKEWILYSSEGFYKMNSLKDTPQKIKQPPPVNVMGVTILHPLNKSQWLVGSFGGLFLWNRKENRITDAFTKKTYKKKKTFGPPVISNPVSGFSDDFSGGMLVYDYHQGAKYIDNNKQFIAMPPNVKNGNISLWHLSLEVHVGRIYRFFMGRFSVLFILISGLIFSFILISGYKVYVRKHKKRKRE